LSRNQHIRTCYRRSFIPRTRQKMEIYCIFIKNNVTGRTELQNLQQKLLAIVEAITKWRQYLLDTTEKFEVWTDYENLKYFREPHKLNGQQAWWYLKLQDYSFILQHIPGKTNTKADVLSRKDHIDTMEDNKDIQMFKKEMWIRKQITAEIEMI